MNAPAAIILHHNSSEALAKNLTALVTSTLLPQHIVVLDNSSDASAAAEAEKLCAEHGIRHVQVPNEGYGAAMNLGLADLLVRSADFVLMLTHETVLSPTCLAELESALRTDDTLAAVGPVLGRLSAPEMLWSAGGVLDADWRVSHLTEPEHLAAWTKGSPRQVDWVDGAAVMIRRTALDQTGGFDERFFLYWEEIELQRRMVKAGWRVAVVPSAVAWQSSGSDWAKAIMQRNKLLFVETAANRRTAYRVLVSDLHLLFSACKAAPRSDRRAMAAPGLRGISSYVLRRWGLI